MDYWDWGGIKTIMYFNEDFINSNKDTIIELLETIQRKESDIPGLISKLESSDFFIAPASTRFHNHCRGGLADHSLNVYYNLKSLVKNKHLEDEISDESIIICGLLHDMAKINFYEPSIRNKKVYSDTGSKRDNLGRFDWVSEYTYAVKPEKERFLYGNHEETSEFMVRQFIPLTIEESVAILHHHAGKGFDSVQSNIASTMCGKYPLVILLHVADCISTYIDENE